MANDFTNASYKFGYQDGYAGKVKNYYGPYGQHDVTSYNKGYEDGRLQRSPFKATTPVNETNYSSGIELLNEDTSFISNQTASVFDSEEFVGGGSELYGGGAGATDDFSSNDPDTSSND